MGKKAAKKDKKDDKKIVGPQAPIEINENHKEYYIVQIRDLEERVSMLQKKCDELEIKNAEYQVKLDRMIDDQNDIVSFIEKKLARKIVEIKEMNENYVRIQDIKLEEQKLYEEQMAAIENEHKQVEEILTAENQMLTSKIAQLEDFQQNREILYGNIKKLEANLFTQLSEHKDARYVLEKQHRIEKDKLKQEMIEQVKIVANEFKKQSKVQLSETTKRTIRETVAINNQLIKMSEKTAEIIEENEQLKQKSAQQKREILILEESEKKLIRKNVCNHHTLMLLKAKCQTLGDSLTRGVIETRDKLEELIAERRALILELKQARSSLIETYTKNKEQDEMQNRMIEEVQEKTILKSELEKLIDQSALAIENVIKPLNMENCEITNANYSLRREQVLEVLLLLLNSPKSGLEQINSAISVFNETSSILGKKVSYDETSSCHPQASHIGRNVQQSGSQVNVSNKITSLIQSVGDANIPKGNKISPTLHTRQQSFFQRQHNHFMENLPLYKPGYLGLIPRQNFTEIELNVEKLSSTNRQSQRKVNSAPPRKTDIESKCQTVIPFSSKRPQFSPKVLALAQQLVTRMPSQGMKLVHGHSGKKESLPSITSDQMWMS